MMSAQEMLIIVADSEESSPSAASSEDASKDFGSESEGGWELSCPASTSAAPLFSCCAKHTVNPKSVNDVCKGATLKMSLAQLSEGQSLVGYVPGHVLSMMACWPWLNVVPVRKHRSFHAESVC